MRRHVPHLLLAAVVAARSCCGAAVAQPLPATQPAPVSVAAFVTEAAQRFGIPERWIRAVMHVESRGDPHAVSPKGAMGLMQIMPATWATLRQRYGLGGDPFDVRDNILAGAAFLRELHDRYGAAGFLAAYSCGPGCYDDHLATGRPLPAETRAYVATVAPLIDNGAPVERSATTAPDPVAWRAAPIFVALVTPTPDADRPQADGRSVARPVADLSGLEPSSGQRTSDAPSGASLFVARASIGPAR